MMGFVAELRRRNVIRMAGVYLVGAWLLTQVSSTVLPMFDAPAWLPRTIVILLAFGFVPALIFAWVFELTPEGLKRDAEVRPEESIAPQTARRMDRLIIVLLIVALVYFGIDKFVLAPRREAALVATTTEAVKASAVKDAAAGGAGNLVNDKSIAVLPFADLSPTHDQEYFSDGMTEEILDALAKVQDLRVAARTSSFYFKGRNEKLQAIGTALGVANVLEGSVRKQGNKVRITAQLIQAHDGFHLWSQSYDGELTDVFELQERIARAITDALKVVLQGEEQKRLAPDPTRNAEAHEQYLRGRYLWNQRGYANLQSAEVAFKAALAGDPGYADAWAGLAQTYSLMPTYAVNDPAGLAAVDTAALARDAADHAVALDPHSSAALTARANIRFTFDFDWDGAEQDFRAAIAANAADATAHQWYAEMLLLQRRSPEADVHYKAAIALDPLSAVLQFSRGISLATEAKYAESLPYFDGSLRIAPGFFEPISGKAMSLIDLRRFEEAEAIVRTMSPVARELRLSLIAALKDPAKKPAAIEQIMAHGGDSAIQKPALLARLGEYDMALAELERLFAIKAPFREYIYVIPQFEPLHDNPRFKVLLHEIGLPRPGRVEK
jgi:TolB-like protein